MGGVRSCKYGQKRWQIAWSLVYTKKVAEKVRFAKLINREGR